MGIYLECVVLMSDVTLRRLFTAIISNRTVGQSKKRPYKQGERRAPPPLGRWCLPREKNTQGALGPSQPQSPQTAEGVADNRRAGPFLLPVPGQSGCRTVE